ncbi:MAG: MBOAT family O-acyltransferase [Ferruginibacter sp.]
MIADIAGCFATAAYDDYLLFPGCMLLLGTVLFSIQIYCDFSGYSDMAIGIARMLGFSFKENFRIPYFSKDITEFWRRWHISLSTWLRDYLYISFGGNRYGKWRTYRNILLTMLLGGLWHGASWNFITWGAINGIYLCIERAIHLHKYKPRNIIIKAIRVCYVFILVSFSWIFFRSSSFQQAIVIIKKIFTAFNIDQFQALDANLLLTAVLGIFLLFGFEYFVFRKYSFDQLYERRNGNKLLACFTLLFILLIAAFGNADGNQFIYFQF